MAAASGFAVLPRVKGGCRPRTRRPGHLQDSGTFRAFDCLAFNLAVLASLPAARAEGVNGALIAARWNGGSDSWLQDLPLVVARLRSEDIRVLLVADVPQYPFDVPSCIARRGWTACNIARAKVDAERAADVRLLRTLADETPGVAFWDPVDTMCSATLCSPARDGVVLYGDSHHLSRAGSLSLAKAMAPALDWVTGRTDVRP